ncbi:aldo/keto reductase family oxidoreductase, putative [Eimeria brunetti]|uniref:Aldo/keto reductase family oxidoreductase, putative n=1 Tax=Eimeria brunetti TaxID=51314 RepID=U6LMI2_9EIME|nr:aldo/keto reductase family oxidoreductase, putative [Eimeria brunetti]
MACPSLAGVDLLAAAKCRTLHNGVQMPVIGLGTWRLRGDRLRSGVFGALNERYGLIDSAAVYGNEEEIKQLLKEAGNPRVFLTSKLQPGDAQGTEAVVKAFEQTIERLGVQQLDLYLIHWPGSGGVEANDQLNRRRRIESWRALEQLYEQKKVRAIGVSNFMVPHLEQLMEDGAKIRPMVNQIEWHPMCWVPDLIPYAEKHNIVLQAYSSLGSGETRLLDHDVVKQIAKEINQPPSVVLLRWPLQQGLLVIPCSTSQEHLKENLAALDVQLSEDQMKRLCAIRDTVKHRFCWDPNTIA